MPDVDVTNIVPSTRDLLQVLSTRRRSLALVGLITPDRPAEEAARLADLNVSAFASAEPSPGMAAAARATRTVPCFCLAPARDRDEILSARKQGADGVAIDARISLEAWDKLAKVARSMRMAPIAFAVDAVSFAASVEAGARGVLIACPEVIDVLDIAAKAPRGLTLVAYVENLDGEGLRSLAGKVDAAIVPASIHTAPGFAKLVADVDP